MTRREAALILGLRESAAEERVKEAHRRIMIANHPDSGKGTESLCICCYSVTQMAAGHPSVDYCASALGSCVYLVPSTGLCTSNGLAMVCCIFQVIAGHAGCAGLSLIKCVTEDALATS
jgi:hypothetical protein